MKVIPSWQLRVSDKRVLRFYIQLPTNRLTKINASAKLCHFTMLITRAING